MTHQKDTPRSIRYTWDENSHISRLDAKLDDDGFYVIQLFPGKNEKEGALAKVPAHLRRYGFKDPYPDVKDSQSVLSLANVKSIDKLIGVLNSGGFISGTPTIEAINGHKETISEAQRREEEKKFDTVKAHGYVALAGHAAIFLTGILQKDWGRLINAPLGVANPALMSWLGSGKDNMDVPELMRDMRAFFAEEGINLPYMSGEDQYRGFFETAKHFLMAHPIEVGSTLGAVGSVAMVGSGIKGVRANAGGWSRIALGLVNVTRDGIAIFVPEKKKKDTEVTEMHNSWASAITSFPERAAHYVTHPKEIPGAAWGFVQSFPLPVVAALSVISDALYAADAVDAFKKNQKFRSDAYVEGNQSYKYRTWFGFGKEKEGFVEAKDSIKHVHNDFVRAQKTSENLWGEMMKIDRTSDFDNWRVASKNWEKANAVSARLQQENKNMENNVRLANHWSGKATPWLNLVPAVAFLGAAFFMAQSSKHHKPNDVGNEAMLSRLYSINAKILTVVPEDQREQVLGRLTDYFRTRKDIGDKFDADRFKTEVRSRIKQMEHNPWTERVTTPSGLGSHMAGAAIA